MFRVVSCNVNGLRSAVQKGFLQWLEDADPDVLCLQEVKAQETDLPADLLRPEPRRAYYHFAQARGYSGTALFAKSEPRRVTAGFGNAEFDREGRYIEAEFAATTVISAYFPSGSSSPERQEAKFRFLGAFLPHLRALQARGREIILCGDINIAHKEIDLKNWRANRKNSGFLPEERAWIGNLFEQEGWVDVFRRLDARPDQYTWWSNRGQAWEKNVGWRIDYQIATPGVAAQARNTAIYKDRRFSDHAPLIVDYAGTL